MGGRLLAAVAAFSLLGCGPVLPTPMPTPLGHPSGERELVLRMSVGGGLPWPAETVEEPADWTLYGKGHLIRLLWQTTAEGTRTTELRHGQVDAGAVDALLRFALNEGGLALAAERYDNDQIFDAGTTTFVINAGGVSKTVHVYALGFMDESTPNARERAAFKALLDRLDSVGLAASDLGVYRPEAYLVTLEQPFADAEPNADWPWPDLVSSDFAPAAGGARTRIVTAAQGEAVLSLGITHDLVVIAPDGRSYMIRIQTLLPDEID